MILSQFKGVTRTNLGGEFPLDSLAPLTRTLLPLFWVSVGLFLGDRAWDRWLFSVINFDFPNMLPSLFQSAWDFAMVALTTLGDAIVLIWVYLLFNFLAWLAKGDYLLEELKARCFVFTLVLILATLPIQGLKEYFLELRPSGVLLADQLRILAPTPRDFSFPSGHTAGIFACVGALLPLIPRGWLVPAIVLAFLVGFSRIAVGAHWPLDVSAGAFIGSLTSIVSWKFTIWVQRKRLNGSKLLAWFFQSVVNLGFFLIAIACIYSVFYLEEHRTLVFGIILSSLLIALMTQTLQISRLRQLHTADSAINTQTK